MSVLPPDPQARTPRSRSLSMRQLEVFHAIMETGSISGAALALYVSQPALSRALAHCEDRLGYPLFERAGRRLQPTPEALRLHEAAREVYRGLDRINALAQSMGEAGADILRIAASAMFANSLVPQALTQLMQHRPALRIDFRTATYDELPDYLLSGQADIGISLVEPQHPGLKSRLLGQQNLLCILPASHPLADEAAIDPQQLGHTAWIGYPADTPLGRICGQQLAMDVASASIQVRSPVIALKWVQMGLGAAIVDASSLPQAAAGDCVVRPLSVVVQTGIWAITSARHPCPAIAQHFVDALYATIQRVP